MKHLRPDSDGEGKALDREMGSIIIGAVLFFIIFGWGLALCWYRTVYTFSFNQEKPIGWDTANANTKRIIN
jgi:hypothetical protein